MEKIILFGCGRLGKRLLPDIRRKYTITYWVDNDKSKWGEIIDGIMISSPEVIDGFKGKIVIIVSDFELTNHIAEQLFDYGIKEHQIIWYCNICEETLLPYNCRDLYIEDRKLIEFDQYHIEDRESNKKKILIFCYFFSSYVIQLIKNIKKRCDEIEFSIITRTTQYNDILSEYASHIYVYSNFYDLKTILVSLPKYYALHMLWMDKDWLYFSDIIKDISHHCLVNVGGSDFYRSSDFMRKKLHLLVDISEKLNVQSVNVKNDYLKVFPNDLYKISIVNYGLEIIEYIPTYLASNKKLIKKEFNIPDNKIIITCGHNGYRQHNHIEIVKAVSKLDVEIKKNICCIFPMTYPDGIENYINEIKELMEDTGVEYRVLVDFMDFDKMAKYACISDIMIHVQTTDQLSSTMLEEMYAGSIIIAGSWLPYQWLRDESIYFESVDDIVDVTGVLSDVVSNINEYRSKCINNREIVYRLCSWENVSYKWLKMWNILV